MRGRSRRSQEEGGNERTPSPTTARITIKTPPCDHNRDANNHGAVRVSMSASCSAETVENDNDAEMGTNVGAVEG
jgi:hypothetical protein